MKLTASLPILKERIKIKASVILLNGIKKPTAIENATLTKIKGTSAESNSSS